MVAKSISPEQHRIAELERALEVAMYWLLRAHDSWNLERWEPGPSVDETMTSIHCVLCNHDLDPCVPGARGANARALRRKSPEYFHHELEKAVKRVTR